MWTFCYVVVVVLFCVFFFGGGGVGGMRDMSLNASRRIGTFISGQDGAKGNDPGRLNPLPSPAKFD